MIKDTVIRAALQVTTNKNPFFFKYAIECLLEDIHTDI